jgi:hypothetical protein
MYANVLGKPVLAPDGVPTSLGSGIFALLAAAYSNPSSKRSRRFVCLSRPLRPNPRRPHLQRTVSPLSRGLLRVRQTGVHCCCDGGDTAGTSTHRSRQSKHTSGEISRCDELTQATAPWQGHRVDKRRFRTIRFIRKRFIKVFAGRMYARVFKAFREGNQ